MFFAVRLIVSEVLCSPIFPVTRDCLLYTSDAADD